MTLRRATDVDLDAIMALERASFPTDAWSVAMMREELRSPHGWYGVVEEAGNLVGYGGIRAARGATDADIQTIAIADGARGRGRGRMLLGALLAEGSRRGAREVFLEVRADNPVAQGLYASEGFLEVGRRPRYYQPDGVDAVVMKLDLAGWAARHPLSEQEIWRTQDDSAPERPVLAATPALDDGRGAADAGACT